MTSYQKFTKDIGSIGFVNLLGGLKGIIFLPLITKFLGALNYGVWAQLTVTLGLLPPLLRLGLPYALVRFLAAERDRKKIQEGVYSVLLLILAFSSIAGLFLIISSRQIADFFQCQMILIIFLSFIILFECLNTTLLSVFQAFQEIKNYSYFMVCQTLGEIGLVAATIVLGYGLSGVVLSFLIIRITLFLILFISILKKIGIKTPDFSKIREYLRFGLPTVVSNASYWTVTSSDRYLIGFFLGVLSVGYYAPAYAIGNTLNFFIIPLSFVLLPVVSKFFDEYKIDKVKTYLKYALKYFLLIAVPSVFGLSILSKPLLTILSTKEIAENAFFIIPFVSLSILLYGGSDIFGQIIVLAKKTKITGAVWVVAAFLNLLLNIIFIPLFGILGAALTTLLAYALSFIMICYYSFKELRFEVDWKFLVKSILASSLMGLYIFWLAPTGAIKTIFAIVSGASIYAVIIVLLGGIKRKEIDFFKKLLIIRPK